MITLLKAVLVEDAVKIRQHYGSDNYLELEQQSYQMMTLLKVLLVEDDAVLEGELGVTIHFGGVSFGRLDLLFVMTMHSVTSSEEGSCQKWKKKESLFTCGDGDVVVMISLSGKGFSAFSASCGLRSVMWFGIIFGALLLIAFSWNPKNF